MRYLKIRQRTVLNINESVEGETIEEKMERIIVNKEPIEDSAPIIWQERKEGVKPEYDIRTDRFDIALDATEIATKSKLAKRQARQEEKEKSEGSESTQATE